MRILVVGSGGREHALCWALRQGGRENQTLFCAPGNAGIAEVARRVPVGATDVPALASFAESERIDLTVVGGESSLAAGIADEFEGRGLIVAGPHRRAARLESSKVFAKEFMERHRIPTAHFRAAGSASDAWAILRSGEFGPEDAPVVIKADGLAAGKGVVVARGRAEAEAAVENLMGEGSPASGASRHVVIEEALEGREVSLLLWTDGRDYILMPAARDHKRVGEGDTGPNTGGMGAITAPEVLDENLKAAIVREIVEPTLDGARRDGLDFRGVLFIGLMLTGAGARVLEYNVRFGDPEAQAILVRLQSSLIDVCEAVAHGRVGQLRVEWSGESSACVVLAARGYPQSPETGARIEGLDAVAQQSPAVKIFHAGTERSDRDEVIVSGGRVLGVTSAAPTLEAALQQCYAAVNDIRWDGMQYRRDIGRFTESRRQ